MKQVFFFLILLLGISSTAMGTSHQPEFSVAGFFELPGSGRSVYSMNPAWRFHKGDIANAQAWDFDDKEWDVVSLPNGIELLPTEASGCINYQGEVWYRKHFTPTPSLKGKKLFLHFEAIMGKSKVFVNGKLLAEHFGGYLPVIVDLTDVLAWDKDNVIAVWADNSNDSNYPPGKPQESLDFSYFGGIYRDCWLIAHNEVFITDPNYENEIAGGGLFVSYDKVSDAQADIVLKTQVRNDNRLSFAGSLSFELLGPDGKQVARSEKKIRVKPGKTSVAKDRIPVKNPLLWSPESPTLYNLLVRIYDREGNVVDGYRKRIGIRSIEFKGKDGFWLNGKPYEKPLIGANRHQDFAIVGNALPNSLHWRDAKKLRDAGLKVIRNAHYPQDPAFMDACDELGLFVIVNTPSWQFWNDKNPQFEQRVYQDIRNMVRRDRNHPSVWLWEPILNETWYPEYFAKQVHDIVDQEYPYPYCYSACDSGARGKDYFSVQFSHPSFDGKDWYIADANPEVTYFTREWGDNVDDWGSHNSPSRVARNWGERPMLVQAQHYARPYYDLTCYDDFFRAPRQLVGGCLWHSFDHQRGYHPDPFYGGLMDVFRQPKYSYYLFQAQRPAVKEERTFETGPMVYIAHEMTPFSDKDVIVYSNCEEVRLTFLKGGKTYTYTKPAQEKGMPSPVIVFHDVYDFMKDKALSRKQKQSEVILRAEGLVGGKVVAVHERHPARRPSKLLLWVDDEGAELHANGSDIVTVVAAVADRNGNIKRLNNYSIKFQIEGEGRILGNADILANPAPVRWGTAPILIQSTLNPGKIKVTASVLFEGSQMPVDAVLELESKPAEHPLLYAEKEAAFLTQSLSLSQQNKRKSAVDIERALKQKEENRKRLQEVEKQQEDFGEK